MENLIAVIFGLALAISSLGQAEVPPVVVEPQETIPQIQMVSPAPKDPLFTSVTMETSDYFLPSAPELDTYTSWMDNLKGEDIAAIYGQDMPTTGYADSTLSLADSQEVLALLKEVSSHLEIMTEKDYMNPSTGGAYTLAFHQEEGVTSISYNGWFTVGFSDQHHYWSFLPDEEGEKLLNEIWEILGNYTDTPPTAPTTPTTPLYYQGTPLEQLYAVDMNNYTMAEMTHYETNAEVLNNLVGGIVEEEKFNGYAYLIYNGDGKQYQYLQEGDTVTALTKNCVSALSSRDLHPSWLIHFNPHRLVEANGITDRDTLEELSVFLKEELLVESESILIQGEIESAVPTADYSLTLIFDSDVEYRLTGDAEQLNLYTTDLDLTVCYTLSEGVGERVLVFLRDLMGN